MTLWQPIDTAPTGRVVRVETLKRRRLLATLEFGFYDEAGNGVFGWVAADGEKHPPCWDDGVCWASNASDMPSDAPVKWQHVRPNQAVAPGHNGGGEQ